MKNGTSLLKRVNFPRSMSNFNEIVLVESSSIEQHPQNKNFNESTIIEYSKKYKHLATNVVFPRISSIFDPQAIFSVELLPGEGQAHHKMDCALTPAFIGSR